MRESLDMSPVLLQEEDKYERLNAHFVQVEADKKINYTNVRDNHANQMRVAEIKKRYLDAPIEDHSIREKTKNWSKERAQNGPLKALMKIMEQRKQT